MAVGGKKEEYDYNPPEDNLEWWCEWKLNIREIRMIYDSINYYSSIWPGPPERPEQEKQFLENLNPEDVPSNFSTFYNTYLVSKNEIDKKIKFNNEIKGFNFFRNKHISF